MPAVNGVGDSSAVDARRWWASGILHWSVRPPLLLLAAPFSDPVAPPRPPLPRGWDNAPVPPDSSGIRSQWDGLIFSTSERAEVALADTC